MTLLLEIYEKLVKLLFGTPTHNKGRCVMKYIPVESTSIMALGHEEAANMLSIVFLKNKAVYFYAGVPKEVFTAFLAAESKGTFLNASIKGVYPYFKLEEVEMFPVGTLETIRNIQERVSTL